MNTSSPQAKSESSKPGYELLKINLTLLSNKIHKQFQGKKNQIA